jgi:hypothetical protein
MESEPIDVKKEIDALQTQIKEMQVAFKDFGDGVTDFSRAICSTLSTLCDSQENLSKDVVKNMAAVCDLTKRMSDLFKISDERASDEKIMYV